MISGLKLGLCFHFFPPFNLWHVSAESHLSNPPRCRGATCSDPQLNLQLQKKSAFSLGDHSTSFSLQSRAFLLVCPTKAPLFVGYLFTALLEFLVPVFPSFVVSVVTVRATGASSAPSFLVMSGSQRKNSCRSVLTVSGHSIMTM